MTWIQTYTGRAFEPLNPDPDDIDPLDIAHALSMVCRFTGHTRRFYSVAEHSVRVSWLVEEMGGPMAGLCGLLHDASEAYIADVARPLKHSPTMAPYRAVEARIQDVVLYHFGITPQEWNEHHGAVKRADNVMLATEVVQLMQWPPPQPWAFDVEGLALISGADKAATGLGWHPRRARTEFLYELVGLWKRLGRDRTGLKLVAP